VWVDVDPVRGSEQAGTRPALVVSDTRFNALSHHSMICPITRNMHPWPTKLALPSGLPVNGAVLLDQIRSVDRRHRGFRPICKVPPAFIRQVKLRLIALLGVTVDPENETFSL